VLDGGLHIDTAGVVEGTEAVADADDLRALLDDATRRRNIRVVEK